MQFYIDIDEGSFIAGWLAPDNPGIIPKVKVVCPDREELIIEASVIRADIKDAGLHNTGQVGFQVDTSLVPDLANQPDIEILDAATDIQIYHRNDTDRHVQTKLVYFDASLMPQNKIYRTLNSRFAMNYNFVERHAFDTMACLINAGYMQSVILTGRPYLSRYIGHFKNKGFFTSVLVSHPIEELAERILFIQLLGKSNAAHLLPTFMTGFEALTDFAINLDIENEKALNTAFRSAKPEVKAALSNPMVRIMGCQPGEEPERRHLGLALDNLSTVDAVGMRERFSEFKGLLAGLLGADVLGEHMMAVSPAVTDLADRLAGIGAVSNLLEYDLVLHSYVEDAIENALTEETAE
ncbi:MAG: hypothetical protein K2P80_05535 [Beijerinckiaceae bacterium]|nr:hypothetical protein [Beijerinckiaceae bacterium]